MKRLVLSAAVLIVLFAAPTGLAQGTGGFQFGLAGGVSAPSSRDISNSFDNGYHGGLVLNYELPALPLGLRVDGDYRHFSAKTGYSAGSAQVVDGNANLVVGIRIAIVKVYALGGAGLYNVRISPDVGVSTSQTQFGWNAGAGVAFVAGRVSIFGEGRYHEVTMDVGQGKFTFVAVSGGILF